jgi:hypothetical protein
MSIRTGTVMTVLLLLSGVAGAADQAGGQSGALGSSWADAAKMPDLFTGMWMTFGGRPGTVPPYTAKAQQYVDTYKPKLDMPYAEEGCKTPGLPIAQVFGPIKFTYAPGMLSIYMQATGHTRFIRMNQPMGTTSPKYYGNSVGHWEGDTLVVETRDFLPEITFQYGMGKGLPADGTIGTASIEVNTFFGGRGGAAGGAQGGGRGGPPGAGGPPGGDARGGGPPGGGAPGAGARGGGRGAVAGLSSNIWGPHGKDMYMVERMRLVNPNSLELTLTIYDDTVWTKPNETTRTFTRIVHGVSEFGPFSGEPTEWVCTVSITSFDPDTNTYTDKDPAEMVKYLDKLGR